jgi:protein-tyrosine-phosphatase
MAEGYARHHYSELMEVSSAGLHPAPIVQPETIAVMEHQGISLEGQSPKPISAVDWKSTDLVVNMSGMPVLQAMPGFEGLNLMWVVDDPIGKSNRVYNKVRDRIGGLVDALAETLRTRQSRAAAL